MRETAGAVADRSVDEEKSPLPLEPAAVNRPGETFEPVPLFLLAEAGALAKASAMAVVVASRDGGGRKVSISRSVSVDVTVVINSRAGPSTLDLSLVGAV